MAKPVSRLKLNKKFSIILQKSSPYQDSRNDEGHAEIVTLYAQMICLHENLDENIVIPSAILHDIGWSQLTIEERMLIFDKNAPAEDRIKMRYRHQEESVKLARELLRSLKYEADYIDEICEIISKHDTREGFYSPNEGAMRDADKLWRFDETGFLSDNINSNKSYQQHIRNLEEYLKNSDFFYFSYSRDIAIDQLRKLKALYINE